MLEIHGVPTRPDEETDDLVCKVVELVDPDLRSRWPTFLSAIVCQVEKAEMPLQ